MNKKGAELSLSVVIIAVILILVLAVVGFIFFRGTSGFSDGISHCEGMCVKDRMSCENYPIVVPMKCSLGQDSGNTGSYCCRQI